MSEIYQTQCQDIYVKFHTGNGQHISFRDGPTASHKLEIRDDGIRLQVLYLNANTIVLKSIVFPYTSIKEYSCENIATFGGV